MQYSRLFKVKLSNKSLKISSTVFLTLNELAHLQGSICSQFENKKIKETAAVSARQTLYIF